MPVNASASLGDAAAGASYIQLPSGSLRYPQRVMLVMQQRRPDGSVDGTIGRAVQAAPGTGPGGGGGFLVMLPTASGAGTAAAAVTDQQAAWLSAVQQQQQQHHQRAFSPVNGKGVAGVGQQQAYGKAPPTSD